MTGIEKGILDSLDNFHLAGIVPLSGFEVENKIGVLHPGLLSLSSTLLAVERSIIECNYAGCKTIWVVCNENYQPIIRQRVKDFTTSFYSLSSAKFSRFGQTKIKHIPIYYVSIPASLRGKRDSLGWAVLHAAQQAFYVCAKISKWLVPNKYFVSNPYGIHDPKIISENKSILTSTHNLFITEKDKSVANAMNMSFSFRPDDFIKIRKNIKSFCTGSVTKPYWSSRNFSIDKFFNYDNISNVNNIEVDHYYSLTSWEDYRNFIKSKDSSWYERYNLQNLNQTLKERIIYENE